MKHPLTFVLASLLPALAGAQHHGRHHHRAPAAPAPTPAPAAPAALQPAPAPPPPVAVVAPPPPVAVVAPVVVAASEPALEPSPPPAAPGPRRFALEFGPVLGLDVATHAVGVGPDLGLEVGGRVAVGPGVIAFAVRGTWPRYTLAASAAAPCAPGVAPAAPCVSSPAGGAYDYELSEDVVRVSLPVSYRFLAASSALNAYVGVAPQLVLQRAETTAWNLLTTETATRFGVGGFVGVQHRLGPGSLWFEAGYAWSPVSHRVTGDSALSTVTLALGYRVAL